MEQKIKVEYRYYEIPEKDLVLALLGEEWVRSYGLDYLHFHNYMEVGICRYGEGEVLIEEQSYPFKDTQATVIPPNVPHEANSKGEVAFWEWLYIDVAAVLEDMFPNDALLARQIKQEVYKSSFFIEQGAYPALMAILNGIMDEMRGKRYMYRESIKGYLRAFIVELLRMNKYEKDLKRTGQDTLLIAAAIDYVEEHYREEIKIGEMAAACSMSESYFRKLFWEYMGIKPLDYLNVYRVWKACDLMGKSDRSMETIAFAVGFKNESTFTRNFKKVLDMTPYQWKRSAENNEGKMKELRMTAQKGW